MNIKAYFFIPVAFVFVQILSACSGGGVPVTSTPTVMSTPTTDPMQAAKTVEAFWDALEAGDLDTAMVYVSDDVTCTGYCHFKGKDTFRSYLQGYLDAGYSTRISDIRSVGSMVTYSWEVYRNGNFLRGGDSVEVMQVEDSKIVYWENLHQ